VLVTDPVPNDTDDPAIWINAADPLRSLILGTDKGDTTGGVFVFDLEGRLDPARSRTPMFRANNVDVAYGLELGGRRVDVAVATERGAMALRVFPLPDMTPVDGGGIPVFDGDEERAPMGIALYTRASDGALFAIVGGKGGPVEGYLWQLRLRDRGDGVVTGERVRAFGAFSGLKEIEAIAVDDALGFVSYSDEGSGIRKYHADPDHPDASRELAHFGREGFVEDHEGIAVYAREDGTGYLIVSDQQGGRIRIFPREGSGADPHAHTVLAVIPMEARDTDGLEVTPAALGPRFPRGLLVLMSADRTFHYHSWADVEARIPGGRR
jgi:3-phytase